MERFPPQKPENLSDDHKKLYEELSEIKDKLFGDQYCHRTLSKHEIT
jgi:hypothetical protein